MRESDLERWVVFCLLPIDQPTIALCRQVNYKRDNIRQAIHTVGGNMSKKAQNN